MQVTSSNPKFFAHYQRFDLGTYVTLSGCPKFVLSANTDLGIQFFSCPKKG